MLSYLLPDEKPYVMLKSNKEEYIFTDCAYIESVGTSNIGSKRAVNRFDYCEYRFTNILIFNPGLTGTDFDGVLHFTVGGAEQKIEIKKSEWEDAKKLYVALQQLHRAQYMNALRYTTEKEILSKVTVNNVTDLTHLGDAVSAVAEKVVNRNNPISYAEIFERLKK